VSSVLRGFGVVAFDIISMMFEAEKRFSPCPPLGRKGEGICCRVLILRDVHADVININTYRNCLFCFCFDKA